MVMRTGSDLPITIYTDSQYAITMCRLVQRFKNVGGGGDAIGNLDREL